MSNTKRKICFYNLQYRVYKLDPENIEPFFEKEHFIAFLDFIIELNTSDTLLNKKSQKKAVDIEELSYIEEDKSLFQCIIKSCKYNHSPDYMSSVDGSERESDKKTFEGEKELTHICGKITDDEVIIAIEERKSGISMKFFVDYFNWLYQKYDSSKERILISGIIPNEGFLEALNKVEKLTIAEIHIDKRLLGSEGLRYVEEASTLIRENMNLQIKSKPKESLPKRLAKELYENLISSGSTIHRIRLYGKDSNKSNISIDTDTLKKIEHVNTEINEKGIVNSQQILEQLKNTLV